MAVPFTILTGWLGAGKTTTLNEILPHLTGRRVAVLVNELGRIAIDTKRIVSQGSDVLELAGGCVCCSLDLRNDLWDGIHEIVTRSKADALVLETTGIAEPGVLIENLTNVDDRTRSRIFIAGVVSVVDATAGAKSMNSRREVQEQLRVSDRVLLRKLDVADASQLEDCHKSLGALAAHAERATFPSDEAGSRSLAAWVMEPRKYHREASSLAANHRHGQLTHFVFAPTGTVLRSEFQRLVQIHRATILRAKGFLQFAGESLPSFVEFAGTEFTIIAGSDESTGVVFIVDGPSVTLEAALRTTVVRPD